MEFLNVIIAIGVATTVGGLIYIGRKLQILDDLKIVTDKVKGNLKVISDFLIRDNKNFDSSELQVLSPFTLTAVGENFIKKIGFQNVFNEHKEDFLRCIESEKPKLKYDVETAAMKSISMGNTGFPRRFRSRWSARNRASCSSASVSSEKPFASSSPPMYSSTRSA